MKKQALKVYINNISGDVDTPITLYQKYVGQREGFLLESKEQPKGRYSIIATNPFMTIKSFGDDIHVIKKSGTEVIKGKGLSKVKEIIERYEIIDDYGLPFAGGAVGSVGYDVIKQYEKIEEDTLDDAYVPEIHLMFICEGIIYDHFKQTIMIMVLDEDTEMGEKRAYERLEQIGQSLEQPVSMPQGDQNVSLNFKSNISKQHFEDNVELAKKYIYEGDVFQVVLSQRWSSPCKEHPFTLYRKLRRLNPSPYMYYFNMGDYFIVGSSPEMLVRVKDNVVYNCPIAGTRKRGKDEQEDKMLAEDLLSDEKEIAEHIMLVDLGRNDMGRIAKFGSVEVTKYMQVENYSHVMHITSLVEGIKADDKDMFEVLMSFLPAGTLSGAPKIRAMEIIEELETTKRGIYGGAIGYFGFNQTMDMCIAIRTMVIKDEKVYIQAGAGIVADSVAEKEYEETKSKAKALMAVFEND